MADVPGRSVDGAPCARCRKVVKPADAAVVAATPSNKVAGKARCLEAQWCAPRTIFHAPCFDTFAPRSARERSLRSRALASLERHDGQAEIDAAAASTAALLLRGSALVFTGAGISVAAGIPDYRGTIGVDTRAELRDEEAPSGTDYTALVPTRTHRAIARWGRVGFVQHVITQNCDDLHARAGTPRGRLTELHGNVFVEHCEDCHKAYVRAYEVDAYSTDCHAEPWYVRCDACGWNHYTGRTCTACTGRLRDTIVNFGDELPTLERAQAAAKRASVCLALGSSLTVTPASDLVRLPTTLVVCNLQRVDADAAVRVHCEADVFVAAVEKAVAASESAGRGRKRRRPESRAKVHWARAREA